MRKAISAIIASVLLLGSCASVLAEDKYVSIKEIRETIPERWTGEYTDKEGNTIAIDAPIVVPEVDTVPIVRITWGGPTESLNESLRVIDNKRYIFRFNCNLPEESGGPKLGKKLTVNGSLSWEDAEAVLLKQLHKYIPTTNAIRIPFQTGKGTRTKALCG